MAEKERLFLITYLNKERMRYSGNFKAVNEQEAVKQAWKYAIAIESVKEVR